MERERFWSSRAFSWASFFFYANRYLALFGHVPVIVQYFWTTRSPLKIEICHTLHSYHEYYAVVVQLIVAILLTMRMYALYNRNRWVLGLFVGTIVGALSFGCWAILSGKSASVVDDFEPDVGCFSSLTRPQAIRLALAWGGMLIFDVLVFCFTLYKSLIIGRMPGRNLMSVFLRDGAMYFGVIVVSNSGNIITFLIGGEGIRGMATTFTNIISSVTISRLMLNLRDPSLSSSGPKRTTGLTDTSSYPIVSTLPDSYDGTNFTSHPAAISNEGHHPSSNGGHIDNTPSHQAIEFVSVDQKTNV